MTLSEEIFNPDISSMEENKDVEGLINALEHKDFLIRKEAARSLKKVGDERAIESLIQSLKYESWKSKYTLLTTVREYSAEALGIIGDMRAVKPLILAMNEDVDDEVRWKSTWALGKIGDYSAVDELINALNSDSWTVRENAAKALGNMKVEEAVDPLIKTLEDKEWRVRKYAVIALGEIGDKKAVESLLKTLKDEDADVARKTVDALGKMGNDSFQPLMDLFNGKDWFIRSKAAEVLGNIGDRRAVQPFIDTLNYKRKDDRNRYVRGRVVEALGKIGDARAVDALISALGDETIFVRQKSEEALQRIRSLEFASEIIQFNNGSISFDYPGNWNIKTVAYDEKYEGNNSSRTIKFTIHRKTDLEEISLDELIKIWENIFEHQNIHMTLNKTLELENMETFQMNGENLKTNTMIMIVGYKQYSLFYYLHFNIKSDAPEDDLKDINLIVNSFRIIK